MIDSLVTALGRAGLIIVLSLIAFVIWLGVIPMLIAGGAS